MPPGVPSKVIAATCGLTAFVVAILAGLSVGNPADVVLTRSLLCMAVVYIFGMIIGAVGERTMVEAATRYREASKSTSASIPSAAPGSGGGGSVS